MAGTGTCVCNVDIGQVPTGKNVRCDYTRFGLNPRSINAGGMKETSVPSLPDARR